MLYLPHTTLLNPIDETPPDDKIMLDSVRRGIRRFVEAVLNSGNGGQKCPGSEREHEEVQTKEAAGRSQLQQLRIGSRGIA